MRARARLCIHVGVAITGTVKASGQRKIRIAAYTSVPGVTRELGLLRKHATGSYLGGENSRAQLVFNEYAHRAAC